MGLTSLILASSLAAPLRDCDTAPCYPTAYVDHGQRDWACRGLTFNGHSGTDFGIGGLEEMDRGRPVYAAAAGQVIQVEDGHFDRCLSGNCEGGDGYGNHILIDHGDGRHSLYAHLRNESVVVEVGEVVDCGTAIGLVGSSGFSTGAHLHFEWRLDDESIDPFAGPCGEPSAAWVEQGPHGALPARLCAGEGPGEGEDKSRILEEPAPGETVAAQGTRLHYCWQLENSGSRPWEPEMVSAVLVSGERLDQEGNLDLSETILPGISTQLCAELTVDGPVGERVRASWRLARAGSVFGAMLIVRIDVVEPVDPGSDGGPVTPASDAGPLDLPDAGGRSDSQPGCGCVAAGPTHLWLLLLLLGGRRIYRAGTLN